ncbi:hypothetical protein INT47_010963 [Mucor saturninus]|uniref:Myb-like domain-containing protein n=1 Tax=Mucor saturninus TaxID=64648 RepID=A0A8H7RBP2_9FUNG|nr:hypothetical protein INT47_010963 [Mucor saturninus]
MPRRRLTMEEKYRLMGHGHKIPLRADRILMAKNFTAFKRTDSLWKVAKVEEQTDPAFPIEPVEYTLNPMQQHSKNNLCSTLQKRYFDNPSPTMTPRMKKYFRAIAVLEYEHDHGLIADTEFGASVLGETCWTPGEKKRFFLAIERCGKNNISEISRRVGPTKTPVQVYEFQQCLQEAAQAIGPLPIDHLSAREMTPFYIDQEEAMASSVKDALEVESYGKHLQYTDRSEIQLLEMWNLSSLTRLFSKVNDMAVLSSTSINFYELIRNFVSDIMVDLHTQLLNSENKTVTKSLMNVTIAKRIKHSTADRRLKHLDILAMLDKRYYFHEPYTRGKSATYLAKRRRNMVTEYDSSIEEEDTEEGEGYTQVSDDKEKGYIQVSDDEEDMEWDSDTSSSDEEEEEKDEMLEPIDDDDAIPGVYVTRNERHEHEDAIEADQSAQNTIGVYSSDEEIGSYLRDDEEDEKRMQQLDAQHEQQLISYLEFHDEEAILSSE